MGRALGLSRSLQAAAPAPERARERPLIARNLAQTQARNLQNQAEKSTPEVPGPLQTPGTDMFLVSSFYLDGEICSPYTFTAAVAHIIMAP
jgi:hypothetical protein